MADDAPPIDLMANADASGENSVDLMGDDSTIDQSGADSLMGGDGGQGAGELMGDDVLRGDLFSPKPQGDDEEDGPGAGQFDSVAAPASQFESIAAPKADEPAAEAPSTTEPAAEEEASAAAPEEAPVAVAAEPEEEEEEVLVKKKVIQPTPVLGGKNCPLPPGAIGGFRPPPPPAPEPPAAEDSVDAPSAEDSAAAPSEEASAEEEEVIKPEDYGDEHTIAALRIQNIQRGQKERAKVKEMKDKGELPGQKRVKRPQPVSKRESEKSVGEISFYDGIGSHYSGELLNGYPSPRFPVLGESRFRGLCVFVMMCDVPGLTLGAAAGDLMGRESTRLPTETCTRASFATGRCTETESSTSQATGDTWPSSRMGERSTGSFSSRMACNTSHRDGSTVWRGIVDSITKLSTLALVSQTANQIRCGGCKTFRSFHS